MRAARGGTRPVVPRHVKGIAFFSFIARLRVQRARRGARKRDRRRPTAKNDRVGIQCRKSCDVDGNRDCCGIKSAKTKQDEVELESGLKLFRVFRPSRVVISIYLRVSLPWNEHVESDKRFS